MRLIAEGALDEEGASIDALAARLGIGARHLSRLFARHVGASPTQVARTARVQRAKRLLDGTDLSMAEVALRAGFGSLRRFNAVFAEVYRRPPTAIRRRGESLVGSDCEGPHAWGAVIKGSFGLILCPWRVSPRGRSRPLASLPR
jgi:AraC-like DNA-binding protein